MGAIDYPVQKGSLLRGYPQLSTCLIRLKFSRGKMAGMNIGYARVSTEDQNLDLQRQALEAAGCEKVYEDHGVSGAAIERPGLTRALAGAQSGDVLVVWKLDRLGRSLPHLVEVINGLREAGVGFRSLQEQIDTTSAGGRFYPPSRRLDDLARTGIRHLGKFTVARFVFLHRAPHNAPSDR